MKRILLISIFIYITSIAYSQDNKFINIDSLKPGMEIAKFIKTDEYPTFDDYLITEIKLKKVKAKGIIDISFTVKRDGTLSFYKVIDGSINESNIKKLELIINNAPKWSPASNNGTTISLRVRKKLNFNK